MAEKMSRKYKYLGDRLKKAIESAGFKSLREFSSFSGLSYRSLQEYAKGAQSPGSEALIKLARIGINPNYILLGEGPPILFRKDARKGMQEIEIELLELMLEHQDRLNSQIHPEWRKQRFPWHRAIWMECAELMDCFPWKWWAKGETDWDNVKIELADLWHFILSWILQEEFELEEVKYWYQLTEANYKNPDIPSLPRMIEAVTEAAILEKTHTCCLAFFRLILLCKIVFTDLARIYFGKNILNRFRQEHGLKEGRYLRFWNGIEDNKVMLRLIEGLEVFPLEEFEAELFRRLEEEYAKAS